MKKVLTSCWTWWVLVQVFMVACVEIPWVGDLTLTLLKVVGVGWVVLMLALWAMAEIKCVLDK